jgi:hypothetical protein
VGVGIGRVETDGLGELFDGVRDLSGAVVSERKLVVEVALSGGFGSVFGGWATAGCNEEQKGCECEANRAPERGMHARAEEEE